MHLVPSGIFYDDKISLIGNGVVIDPLSIIKELDGLIERGISVDNLRISNRAQVILPYHLLQDELEEEARGDNKIGTTKRSGWIISWEEVGREYGTTTGRARRVGWFDSVVVRHSRRVSGITDLSLNSIDVLSGLDTVKICTAYEIDGKEITEYPATLDALERAKPIFKEMPGWQEDITGVKRMEDLPDNARNYLEEIEIGF